MGKWSRAGLQWSLLLTDVSDRDIQRRNLLQRASLLQLFCRLSYEGVEQVGQARLYLGNNFALLEHGNIFRRCRLFSYHRDHRNDGNRDRSRDDRS